MKQVKFSYSSVYTVHSSAAAVPAGAEHVPMKFHATAGFVTNCVAGERPNFFSRTTYTPGQQADMIHSGGLAKFKISAAVTYGARLSITGPGTVGPAPSGSNVHVIGFATEAKSTVGALVTVLLDTHTVPTIA